MNSPIKLTIFAITGAATISLLTSPLLGADKPKHTVEEVMEHVHKGEDNIGKRVVKGTASKADIDTMVAYYESLPLNKPPRGEMDSWTAKTSKLLAAAKAVQASGTKAIDQYKEAANCKACHNAHKPEEQK